MRITEYMYQGVNGEFVEFTNVGNTPIDMTGWSFDDDSPRTPGSFSLSAFRTVAPGESVILTESNANTFRTAWNLCSVVKIIGGLNQNLGRNDEINLYNASNMLVDRLTYGDQKFSRNHSYTEQIGMGNNGFNIEGLTFAPNSTTTAYVAMRAPLQNTILRNKALIVLLPISTICPITKK